MIHKLVCLCLVATSFAIASVTASEVASHKERIDTAEDLKADLKDARTPKRERSTTPKWLINNSRRPAPTVTVHIRNNE